MAQMRKRQRASIAVWQNDTMGVMTRHATARRSPSERAPLEESPASASTANIARNTTRGEGYPTMTGQASSTKAYQSAPDAPETIVPPDCCYHCRTRGGNAAYECFKEDGEETCTRCLRDKRNKCRLPTEAEAAAIAARCPQCTRRGFKKCNGGIPCDTCIRNKTPDFCQRPAKKTKREQSSVPIVTAAGSEWDKSSTVAGIPHRSMRARHIRHIEPTQVASNDSLCSEVTQVSSTKDPAKKQRYDAPCQTQVSHIEKRQVSEDDIQQFLQYEAVVTEFSDAVSATPPLGDMKVDQNSTRESVAAGTYANENEDPGSQILPSLPVSRESIEENQGLDGQDGGTKEFGNLLHQNSKSNTQSSQRPRRSLGKVSYRMTFSSEFSDNDRVEEGNDTGADDSDLYIAPGIDTESEDDGQEENLTLGEDSTSDEPDADVIEEIICESNLVDEEETFANFHKPRKTKNPAKFSQSKQGKGIDLSLPPICDIEDCFSDMTAHGVRLGLSKALKHLKAPIRVATMCSGTESPLLSLDLISKALKRSALPSIDFQHEFSAEIEVFKQAYIERNFQPKILFRDVRDFIAPDARTATTAYGAEVTIPAHIDILVAGFVCKDLSRLNNKGKSLDSGGESGDTWLAVHSYADRFRPGVVLLENVKANKKTWHAVVSQWDKIGYEAAWLYRDTKNYYLPQTRERMYMMAINRQKMGKGAKEAVTEWQKVMTNLERQCSSPYEAFLAEHLQEPSDYSILLSEPDWALCKLRYDHIRSEQRLGILRPITRWSESGRVRPPDFANRKWFESQSSRVYDAIDVAHLQGPQKGYDTLYKMAVWDVSQNVDRFKADLGILPCITPGGMDFSSIRQQALNGSQLLLLQGMPLDRLLFANETQRKRQDLAGNAMSTTVIGASLISAIICGWKTFSSERLPKPSGIDQLHAEVDHGFSFASMLKTAAVESARPEPVDLKELTQQATLTARLCACEGSRRTCASSVRICSACEHTACAQCSGNPKHVYDDIVHSKSRAQAPEEFIRQYRSKLPTRLRFSKFPDVSVLASGLQPPDCRLEKFIRTITEARQDSWDFCIGDISRHNRHWKIAYGSPRAVLELKVGCDIEWLLFVKCPTSITGDDPLRAVLERPIARGTVKDSLLDPEWEFHIPSTRHFELEFVGLAGRSRSWRNRLGLPEYATESVPMKLKVWSSAKELGALVGEYEYLPHCGTASNCLYKRMTGSPLYMLLDSNPIGLAEHDSIVFTRDASLRHYGDPRLILARVDSSWRPWHIKDDRVYTIRSSTLGSWIPTLAKLDLAHIAMNVGVLSEHALAQNFPQDCSQPVLLLDACLQEKLPVQTFRNYSWALEHIKLLPSFRTWQSIKPEATTSCLCAPRHPTLNWSIDKNGVALAHEDGRAAASFERAIKTRAPIFKVEATNDLSETHIRIGINVSSLMHRAQGRLKSTGIVSTSWRLVVDHALLPSQLFPRFLLRSNLGDTPIVDHVQYLRGTQPKSLAWMVSQERGKELTITEVEEEVNVDLSWRVEARAQSTCIVRGGLLADHPSFGKTVTTIALIQSEFERHSPDELIQQNRTLDASRQCLLDSGATLIISPPPIVLQWRSELQKFLDHDQFEAYNVQVIESYAQLKTLTTAELQESRVIIVSWTIFSDEEYVLDLARFTAMPEPAPKVMSSRRAFEAWMKRVVEDLPLRLHDFLEHGPADFQHSIRDLFDQRLKHPDFNAALPLRVRHGSAYQSWKTVRASSSKTKGIKAKGASSPRDSAMNEQGIHQVPLLHLFRFNRVVVDEYHYLNDAKKIGSSLATISIKKISAPKRWVLSGTPALANFSDVDEIASFLGIGLRLGRSCFGDGTTMTPLEQMRRGDQTHVEDFLSQTEMPSRQWHQARHERAQEFLDLFVRQNEAELQHISCSERLVPVALEPAHHAVYLELSQHLISQRMQIKRVSKKLGSDRTSRLNDSLEQSASAEEALLKSALFFETENGVSGLKLLMMKRSRQRRSTEKELLGLLARFQGLIIIGKSERRDSAGRNAPNDEASIEDLYAHFKKDIAEFNWLGDEEASQRVRALLIEASKRPTTTGNAFPELGGEDAGKRSQLIKKRLSQIRETAVELALRLRSERFICSIKDILQPSTHNKGMYTCSSPKCIGTSRLVDLRLVSHCGHTACQTCLDDRIDNEVCVHPLCNASIYDMNLIRLSDFGSVQGQSAAPTFGNKISSIIQIIEGISPEDQAIVFAPNDETISILETIFQEYTMSYHSPSRCRPAASAKMIEDFKNNRVPEERKKILILNLGSESAAGINLVNANHLVFVSPLLAKTQYEYDSAMVQAIARSRRYGQTQEVYIYHVAALHTIDVDILEHRHKRAEGMFTVDSTMRIPNTSASKKEKTKLISNTDGELALVPATWLCDEAKRKALKLGDSTASFTSLINFSETFEHEEE